MSSVDLTTTNVLLGIMAAVSLIELLAVIGVLLAGVVTVRRLLQVISAIEERQIALAAAGINSVLDDLKEVTSAVRGQVKFASWLLDKIWPARAASGK